MFRKTYTYIYIFVAAVILAASGVSCDSLDDFYTSASSGSGSKGFYPNGQREVTNETRHTFIMLSLGYNNLSADLLQDIEDIASGYLPGPLRRDDVVLVYSHRTAKSYNYTTPTSPVLLRIYEGFDGTVCRDTIMTWPEGTVAASKEAINDVLSFIHEEFPSKSYGMLISSHATGWAPAGYCIDPDKFEGTSSGIWRSRRFHEPEPLPLSADMPTVKSIGSHFSGSSSNSLEVDIHDLAAAIPMHLDYILFDACFMGGVEVAYELQEVCDKVIFSQTEILSNGMDYANLISQLLEGSSPDLEGISKGYYDMYMAYGSSTWRSATTSLVDCKSMKALAETCCVLVEKYKAELEDLGKNHRDRPQRYYRYEKNHGIFHDLLSIFREAGASEAETEALEDALAQCVICRYATPKFMDTITIATHSGLSMYLPDPSRSYLNGFYRSLRWNQEVGLVE